ncbi:stage III sporulation protein AA [Caproiciproducens galactitolivorans]|uniref:Stage III sporulation protein AA n=1 Tax=Caproiciproducens galactitolivorans TaxID=642589 RepID=A0ABT4BW94_9FIRM|nr:stage III sporulation protein AA [Caproiciproducens galactitolivorans]MCY1714221.1 stage III sporulation protein AA [Caproiciproducens galactitolivorans]
MENNGNPRFDSAAKAVYGKIGKYFLQLPLEIKNQVQELRIRVNKPVSICCVKGIYFFDRNGSLACRPGSNTLIATKEDIEECFRNICSYSIYSHQNEIRNGYVTLVGGHRVGISGTAVMDNGEISGIRDISSINIRIAREIAGSANELLDSLKNNVSTGLLIAGPPVSGKTTLLRDIARQLASGVLGNIRKVAVIDERGELAGTCMGVPQNDLGVCSDILDGYPKAQGIMQAIRCLSPEYIVCDELGGYDEVSAVEQSLNAGVIMISSIHAGSLEEFLKKRQAVSLLETGAFGSVAILNGQMQPGKIAGIYKAGELLAKIRGGYVPDCGRNDGGIYGVA